MNTLGRILEIALVLLIFSPKGGQAESEAPSGVLKALGDLGNELNVNYSINVKMVEEDKTKLNFTFVTSTEHFEDSADTVDSETFTFLGILKPTEGKNVTLSYLLGIRDFYPETKTYKDTGVTGRTIFELGKPIVVVSTGSRSFTITISNL